MSDNTDLLSYYIQCIWCNRRENIVEAAKEGWKLCIGCNLVFCPDCQKKYLQEDLCPGSGYTQAHKINLHILPFDETIEFGREITAQEREGKYIEKIFFDPERKHVWFKKDKPIKFSQEDIDLIRFRREQWAKFGVVLVKRKEDGKFVTWGQLD